MSLRADHQSYPTGCNVARCTRINGYQVRGRRPGGKTGHPLIQESAEERFAEKRLAPTPALFRWGDKVDGPFPLTVGTFSAAQPCERSLNNFIGFARFGRSDRSRVGQQVDDHAGFKSSRPETSLCGFGRDVQSPLFRSFETLASWAVADPSIIAYHYHYRIIELNQKPSGSLLHA